MSCEMSFAVLQKVVQQWSDGGLTRVGTWSDKPLLAEAGVRPGPDRCQTTVRPLSDPPFHPPDGPPRVPAAPKGPPRAMRKLPKLPKLPKFLIKLMIKP